LLFLRGPYAYIRNAAQAARRQAAANTPAVINIAPPVRLTVRCTLGLRIARRATDASIAYPNAFTVPNQRWPRSFGQFFRFLSGALGGHAAVLIAGSIAK
jgi:hypothetical protein